MNRRTFLKASAGAAARIAAVGAAEAGAPPPDAQPQEAGTIAVDPATNRTTILSSVDHFDFNWHINYVYADDEAPLLPAGTILHLIGVHDNTQANRRNPDPNMWVGFGERSVDDMLQVWLDMVYLDDAEFQRLVEERKAKPASGTGGQAPAATPSGSEASAKARAGGGAPAPVKKR